MSDPICRVQNPTPKNVVKLVRNLPHIEMSNEEFKEFMEHSEYGGNSFFRTYYQLACQLGLYYIDETDTYHPRFFKDITEEEAFAYLKLWFSKYYVPNPYTRGFSQLLKPILVDETIYDYIKKNGNSKSVLEICNEVFRENIGNPDIFINAVNNFSRKIKITANNRFEIKMDQEVIMETDNNRNDKEAFFKNFDSMIISKPNSSLQRIIFGAPGTGKSHAVKELTRGKNVIRTTFHPDSDYASFVGCYKPTTKQVPVFSTYGEKAVAVKGADGQPVTEDRIVYEFVEQAFLQAYINAWKLYAKAGKDKQPEEQYLIIEEINRGNCAQIFGDLFQLLDRDDAGFSEYPIKTDSDMQKRLEKAFADMAFLNAPALCDMNSEETAIKIRKGEILVLPDNLCIWATMNTSDQSLFPIDSAFKRRWDWQYVPIFDAKENWKIEADGNLYDWWSFLEEINQRIGATTNSEDKKLGYFFCKAENGIISAEKFVNKVIFYLWNDVFKDFGFDDAIFKDEDGSQLTFNKFYDVENGQTIVKKDKVDLFLRNLGVKTVAGSEKSSIEE